MSFRALAALVLVASASPFVASAQASDSTSIATLVGQHRQIGGYVGVESRVTRLGGTSGTLAGAEIAVLVGRRLSIGVAGFGWTNSDARRSSSTGESLRLGYGGLQVGYVIRPTSVVHGVVELLFGAGGAQWSGSGTNGEEDGDSFTVLEPAIGAEANVTRFLRVSLAVTYRHAAGVSLADLRDADLRGASVRLALRAGQF